MSTGTLSLVLAATAALFGGAGLLYSLRRKKTASADDYITARGTIGTRAATATLFASSMGPWLLFGPPEAATWGGLPAVLGYSIGSVLPLLLHIPLGLRMREYMPGGHTIPEYVRRRYGRWMHLVTLLIILFYLFLSLAAQITGVAFIVELIAGIPLWVTAALVLGATVLYTVQGGLQASIFTDGLQAVLILPLLIVLVVVGQQVIGGWQTSAGMVQQRAPELLQWTYRPGVQGGLALAIGIGAASMFNQGTWQRVYAMDGPSTLRSSFAAAALLNLPIIGLMGLFGLAAVGLDQADPASIALFNVLLETMPGWMAALLIVLGLALVMSSADTIMSAIASLIITDLGLFLSADSSVRSRMRISKWILTALCLPVFFLAARGYSVLYLFLLADLVCAAAVFPVFAGLFNENYDERTVICSTFTGLVPGLWWFPPPGAEESLLPAFAAALLVPAAAAVLLRSIPGG